MNAADLFKSLASSLKPHWVPLSLGLIGLIFFGYGLTLLVGGTSKKEEVTFHTKEKEEEKQSIVVDVSGAVNKPGVYTLTEEGRIQDALTQAGGLAENADTDWVSKKLNLAAKVKDATKLYIPPKGESTGSTQNSKNETVAGASDYLVENASNLININDASGASLESLPGIGPVTAQKIIDSRPYSSIEELRDRKVVSQSVFNKIKDKISTL